MLFVDRGLRTKSVRPLLMTKNEVHKRYGCLAPRGESKYARRKEEDETPAKARR